MLVAIGGWGDSAGFDTGACTDESRAKFARNVAAMVDETGADGQIYISFYDSLHRDAS